MNTVQSKEMTLRKMKNLINLEGCLKQYAYT